MAQRVLPAFSSTSSKFTYAVELEQVIFNLYFNWSERESAWYMDIYAEDDETLIISRIKLVPGYLLLLQYKAIPGMPAGDMLFNDIESDLSKEDNSYTAWGSRYELVYIESTDTVQ